MSSLIVDSHLRCPYDSKRLLQEIGQDDEGMVRITHHCWHCGYVELDMTWRPRPVVVVSTLAEGQVAEAPEGTVMLRRRTPMSKSRYTGPDDKVVAVVFGRAGGRCEFPGCGQWANDPHHRRERGMGGWAASLWWINEPSNLLAACRHHNDWASNQHPAEARDMGWRLVVEGDLPWLVPVQTIHDPLPVYLDNEGGWSTFEHPPGGGAA